MTSYSKYTLDAVRWLDYERCVEELGNRDSLKIARNTYLLKDGDEFVVKLHKTNIIRFRPDGLIALDSGGWRTATTKDRMNRLLPPMMHIDQERGVWYYRCGAVKGEFFDGMLVSSDGPQRNAMTESEERERSAVRKALRQKIKVYVDGFVNAMRDGKVGSPGAGDCFGCQFLPVDVHNAWDNAVAGTASREMFKVSAQPVDPLGVDHLLSHMEERYYVPSLFVNAVRERGFAQPAVYLGLLYKSENRKLTGQFLVDHYGWMIEKTLHHYMMRRLEEMVTHVVGVRETNRTPAAGPRASVCKPLTRKVG